MWSRSWATFCHASHKEIYLANQTKKIGAWKHRQHLQQAHAMSKMRACYKLGLDQLVKSGHVSEDDARKWAEIDSRLLGLHENTKELLWYSRRRISREYAASPDGLGKTPKSLDDE
jgi:hypothetical protein